MYKIHISFLTLTIAIMRKINLLFFRSFCVFITLLLTSTLVFAQKNVSGRVTDASGSGVAGITVTVKGSNNATQTSNDGTYSVLVPQGANTLVFTGVGYITQELPVSCLLYTSRCV